MTDICNCKVEPFEAQCVTNIDKGKREKWPNKFLIIPKIGDFVEADSGFRLKVCAITHRYARLGRPLIEIELTSRLEGDFK